MSINKHIVRYKWVSYYLGTAVALGGRIPLSSVVLFQAAYKLFAFAAIKD